MMSFYASPSSHDKSQHTGNISNNKKEEVDPNNHGDEDDMTRFRVIASKLQKLLNAAHVRLTFLEQGGGGLTASTKEEDNQSNGSSDNTNENSSGSSSSSSDNDNCNNRGTTTTVLGLTPYWVLTQLLAQYHTSSNTNNLDANHNEQIQEYRSCGRAGTRQDLEGLDQMLEFAAWAYGDSCDDNHQNNNHNHNHNSTTLSLKQKLQKAGYTLLKHHDQTKVAGYLGHYVAIHKTQKVALIGVKGTSSLEDVLTDCCCGYGVARDLEDGTLVVCHDGIWLSAKQLAEDLRDLVEELIFPRGYHVKIVGHSLGGAAAAVLGLLLQSKIPALWTTTNHDDLSSSSSLSSSKLQVYAFACPPILDYQTAKSTSSYITTIVNNADIIPRASLSNLLISLGTLQDVYQQMIQEGMDGTSIQSSIIALMTKLFNGTQGDLLMKIKDYLERLDRPMTKMDRVVDNPNHLFLPGKVILLYNHLLPTEKHLRNSDDNNDDSNNNAQEVTNGPGSNDACTAEAEQDEEEEQDVGVVVTDNGGVNVLRILTLMNDRMIADHSVDSYRSSIQEVQYRVSRSSKISGR
ncbi:hypothetical protein ACA910_013791 [Epithemia clementina (nom. ined.)]